MGVVGGVGSNVARVLVLTMIDFILSLFMLWWLIMSGVAVVVVVVVYGCPSPLLGIDDSVTVMEIDV